MRHYAVSFLNITQRKSGTYLPDPTSASDLALTPGDFIVMIIV